MTIIEPEYIDLVGANPILVGVQSDNMSEPNFRIDVTVTLKVFDNGAFVLTDLVTLSNTNADTEDTIWFDIGKVLPLFFQKPENIATFSSQLLNNNTNEYILKIQEYFGISISLASETSRLKHFAVGNGRDVYNYRTEPYETIFNSNFFMSYQPLQKTITPNQVEMISVGSDRSKLYVRAYLSDGTTVATQSTITSSELHVVLLNVGFRQLELDIFNTDTKHVTHFIVSHLPINLALAFDIYVRYIVDYSARRWDTKTFVFVNSLGGYDSVTSRGKCAYSTKLQRTTRSHPELPNLSPTLHKTTSSAISTDSISCNLGWMSKEERLWLRDLAHSKRVWEVDYKNDTVIPVTVSSTSLNLHQDDKPLQAVSIVFQYTKHEGL